MEKKMSDDESDLVHDVLTSSLLETKKKHDQDKTVTEEEINYLNKGADYLSSFLTGQGIEPVERVPTKGNPLTEEELKCQFANNLIKNGYVTVENGRSKITPAGKEYFDLRTKIAEANVKLTMLKNLKHRKSSKNKKNNTEDKK
jgi:hypothetical protein